MNNTTRTTRTAARAGFTLIELTIVVLILGILAAIAVPKIFEHSDTAAESGLRRTLQVVRDAIDLLSVIAEMLGKAQETRRVSLTDRRMTCMTDDREETQKDETITSTASQTRIDCQQK